MLNKILDGEETDRVAPTLIVERKKRGTGYYVAVRFRNKEDLLEFSKKINMDFVSKIKKTNDPITWKKDIEERDSLDKFL